MKEMSRTQLATWVVFVNRTAAGVIREFSECAKKGRSPFLPGNVIRASPCYLSSFTTTTEFSPPKGFAQYSSAFQSLSYFSEPSAIT